MSLKRLSKAIIFDVGGVFRDSKIVMNQCFKDAFQKYNISIDLDVNSLYHLR